MAGKNGKFVPFSATTRISGIDLGWRSIRKGAVDAILKHVGIAAECCAAAFREAVDRISRTGGTPLARRREWQACSASFISRMW